MTEREKYLPVVIGVLDTRERLEQLAEEAAELAQACLKCVRALPGSRNSTDKRPEEVDCNLLEEMVDVLNAACALYGEGGLEELLTKSEDSPKWQRWVERIRKEN